MQLYIADSETMIDEIQALCAVVEERSLSRAAKQLGISTPKMTRQIQHLESRLEAKLLHRSTRDISLTEAGRLFHRQALEILCHYNSGVKAVQSLSETVSGTVKIGLPVSLSHLWIAPVLHEFCQEHPNVNIHIINGNHLLGLLKDDFDIVVHCGTLPDSSFYFKKICDWRKITCASPTYLEKSGTPSHPYDLKQHNCIDHYDNKSRTWRYSIDGCEQEISIDGTVKINSSIALKTLAQSGLGIVCVPEFSIKKELDSGQLVRLLEPFYPKPFGMYAVYPSKDYMTKKVEAVLQYLEKSLS